MERLADERPLIVWLDDVQWGADSLGFAEHMLDMQISTRTPILFLMTVRSESLRGRSIERALLKRIRASNLSERLEVEPLDATDTRELLHRLLKLDSDLARRVEQRAAGNPLFAVQLVDDWVSSGKLQVGERGFELAPDATVSIPRDIFQLWRERIDGLRHARSVDDLRAFELAAALGQDVESGEWEESCRQLGIDPAADLEDALYRRGLASYIDGGWRFVHGMLRETLQRIAKQQGRWARLNRAGADALVELYGADNRQTADRRAAHLLEADALDEAVTPLLTAARFATERGDFPKANELLERRNDVLDQAGAPTEDERRVRGWILRSELLSLRGDLAGAFQAAEKAEEVARAGQFEEALDDALRVSAAVERHLGHYRHAEEMLEESIDRAVATSDIRAEGLSKLELARVAERKQQLNRARQLLDEARGRLKQAGDSFGLARCLNALGDVARQARDLDEARAFTLEARDRFEAEGMRIGVADCVNDLAEIALLEGDLTRAEELGKRALHLYETLGSSRGMRVRLNIGHVLQSKGDLEGARLVLQRAREYFRVADASGQLATCGALLMGCFDDETDAVAVRDLLDEIEAVAPDDASFASRELSYLKRARALCRERQWEELAHRVGALMTRMGHEVED